MCNRLFGIATMIGIAIMAMVCSTDRAWAEKRIALVIGNSNYQNVPKLPNPSRDAIAIGQMFRDAGFNGVGVIVNANNQELKRALRKFEDEVDQADIAVIYYAGHGLEIGGVNYLIPVDAKLVSDRDADDEAVRLDRVISSADAASKLRVIILDACRDNPFTSLMQKGKNNSRAVASGLGKAEPTSTDTLIAYAAKANSTAEDGDGQHSPFTSAILRNLTIPGLDIRLAFGRVKDEVMRVTGSRQEPFVYGSLGGSNLALVPAPKVRETSEADIRGDYELVAKVGTLRAWEVFLNTHQTGFYADLARAQVAALTEQQETGNSVVRSKGGGSAVDGANKNPKGNTVIAAVPPPPSSGSSGSSPDALEWDKIKDSSDPAVFENFIKKFPNAPLAVNAQKKLDLLRQAQREREAAQKAAEDARIQAEQKKAAEAAAKKRDEDERRAREAEAEQKAKAAEAERKAAEAKQKAEQAERERAAAEATAARAAAEKQAREAEEARKKAERDAKEAACRNEQSRLNQIITGGSAGTGMDDLKSFAATSTCERLSSQIAAATEKFKSEQAKREREAAQRAADAELAAAKKREEDLRRAKAEEAQRQAQAEEAKRKAQQAEQERQAVEAAAQRAAAEKQAQEDERRAKAAEAEQKAKAAEAERQAAEERRKAAEAAKETACSAEQAKLAQIIAKGSEGSSLDDLIAFARTVTCDRLGAQIVATIDRFKQEAAARIAAMPNSPQLVLAAQKQLVRLGCPLPANPDGALNDATRSALGQFQKLKGLPLDKLIVTTALVDDLTKQTDRVCPLQCKTNEVAKGDRCVAVEKPPVTSRRRDDEEEGPARKKQPERRQAEREQSRKPAATTASEIRSRVQAIARPTGGGGGGAGAMIGVGF